MVLLLSVQDTLEYLQTYYPRKHVHELQFAAPDEATLCLLSSLLLFEAYVQAGLQSSDSKRHQVLQIHLLDQVCSRSLTIVPLSQLSLLVEWQVMLVLGF
jgi:hypothetical protein